VGAVLCPANTVIDTSKRDHWSELAKGKTIPFNAVALDAEAYEAQLKAYPDSKHLLHPSQLGQQSTLRKGRLGRPDNSSRQTTRNRQAQYKATRHWAREEVDGVSDEWHVEKNHQWYRWSGHYLVYRKKSYSQCVHDHLYHPYHLFHLF
jgi:hypothetical protein